MSLDDDVKKMRISVQSCNLMRLETIASVLVSCNDPLLSLLF